MTEAERPVWVPDEDDLFAKATVVGECEGRLQVRVEKTGKTKYVDAKDVDQVNPSQFDLARDMAELTYLNEPSVVNNLHMRWRVGKIYTYSGLFLVAVNPYKELPIYTPEDMARYRSAKKDELPPHIYAVSEQAYKSLAETGQDQSVLVTGESGAGKTETTKKVIQYLSHITHGTNCSMDERIWQTNPILESFGNAQTIRNSNSSRFGKFVKIQFDASAKDIIGASIQWYLLEKSRVVHRQNKERNYHVFYQLLSGSSPALKKKLFLDEAVTPHSFNLLKGTVTIDGVDDAELYRKLISAFKIMGFSDETVDHILSIVAAVLWLGQIEYKRSSADQGDVVDRVPIDQAAKLLGVSSDALKESILRPRVKAGKEFIRQSRTAVQAQDTTNALAKALYERLFGHIVAEINQLLSSHVPDAPCIGVLDIAGFEIFEQNSFEQLCINYTNEKLQQFFNHHMFVLEQDEYVKENVDWEYKDYGSDLQPTIELIEQNNNPMGILSILDEESVLPRGSDTGFNEKLAKQWVQNSKFTHNKIGLGFTIDHYAQSVEYSTEGWLEKNKDPLSDAVVRVLEGSKISLVQLLFRSSPETDNKPKHSMLKTVAQRHKQQLGDLMRHLDLTQPHFVRCIIPNQQRSPQKFDNALVLDQLRYNGVLEGIRIARSGFPNRLDFKEFKHRYGPLTGETGVFNDIQASAIILEKLGLEPSQYKVGLSKVFFRNGVLADLERQLEEMINARTILVQALSRGFLTRRAHNREKFKQHSAKVIAECFKANNRLVQDPWWQLSQGLKSTIVTKSGGSDRRKDLHLSKLESNLQSMKDEQLKLVSSRNQLRAELIDALKANEETIAALDRQKHDYQVQLTEHEHALELARRRDEASSLTLKELSKKVHDLRESEQSLEKRTAILKQERDLYAKKADEMDTVEGTVLELRSSIEKLEAELKSLTERAAQTEATSGMRKTELTSLQQKADALKAELENSNGKCAKLLSDVDILSARNLSMGDEIKGLKLELSSAKADAESAARLEDSVRQWRNKYEEAVKALKQSKEELSNALAELQTAQQKVDQFESAREELESAQRNAEETKQQRKVLETQAGQIKTKDQQIQLLQEKLQEEAAERRATCNNLMLENAKLKKALTSTTKEIQKVSDALTQMKSDYGQLKDSFIAKKSECQNSEATIKQLQEANQKEASRRQQAFQSEVSRAVESTTETLVKDKKQLETDLRNATRKIAHLEASLKRANDNADPMAIASLQQEVAKRVAMIHEWEVKFEKLPKDLVAYSKLKEDYERQRRDKNQLVQESSITLLKVKKNADDLERYKAENRRLESRLAGLQLALLQSEKQNRTWLPAQQDVNHDPRLKELADLEFKRRVQERNKDAERSALQSKDSRIDVQKHEAIAYSGSVPDGRALRNISNDRRVSDRTYQAAERIRAESLENELEKYRSQSDDLYMRLEKAELAVKTALRSEESAIRKYKETRTDIEQTRMLYEQEISGLRATILDLQKEHVDKSSQLERMRMVSKVNEDLELRVDHLNKTINELCNERDRLLSDKSKLEQRLLESATSKNWQPKELESQIVDLREREKHLLSKDKKQQWTLEQREKYIAKLEGSLSEANDATAQHNVEIEDLKTENSAMMMRLRRANHDIDETKMRLHNAEKELGEYRRSRKTKNENRLAFV